MSKITSVMRLTIARKLLSHRFEADDAASRKRENELAMRVHRLRYDAPTRRRMDAVPDGWLPTESRFLIEIPGRSDKLYLIDPVRVQFVDMGRYFNLGKVKSAAAQALAVDIAHHLDAKESLARAKRALSEKTDSTLRGFATIERLVKAWPEVKPFIDQLGYDVAKKSLPAVIPTGLNADLGLPVAG